MDTESRTQPEFLKHACIATRMLNTRRQLFDLKNEVDAQKSEYDRKCAVLQQKEEALMLRELAFQRGVVNFEILSKNHESKQERAATRCEPLHYVFCSMWNVNRTTSVEPNKFTSIIL